MRSWKGGAYDRLIHSWKWRRLRLSYLKGHPVCEECAKDDRSAAATEVHHRIPIESAHTEEGMKRLAFDPTNLVALCHPCHVAAHEALGGWKNKGKEATRKAARAEAQEFFDKWIRGGEAGS